MAEALVPKFGAALSLFGSSMILYELYLDWRQGNARDGATSRILVSISVADIIFSMGFFLSTWPAPSDLTYIRFNVGNQATCTFQGFIVQLGYVASPLFNVALALCFLLRIRYRWTDFRLRRLEPWTQGYIWAFALTCAIYPIPLGLYNNSWEICWIEPYPMDCLDSVRYGDEADCTRGDNAWIHALVFQVFPWVCILCALISMGMIYATVRQVEHRNARYAGYAYSSSAASDESQNATTSVAKKTRLSNIMASLLLRSAAPPPTAVEAPVNTCSQQQRGGEAINPPSSEQPMTPQRPRRNKANHQRSDKVATQAMWYIAAFFATYILDFISAISWYIHDSYWFWLDIFAYFFLPLQGFFNFCVFIRTRKMKSRLGQFARKVLCCLEGSNCWSVMMQKVCCVCHACGNDNDNTTMSGGGVGGSVKKKSADNPCPALPPPSNNSIIDDRHYPKTTKVSFVSPPGERSNSPCIPPNNPCSNNITTDPSLLETTKVSLTLPPMQQVTALSTNSSSSRLDHQESKTEVDTTILNVHDA
jgi:hypothetical protein